MYTTYRAHQLTLRNALVVRRGSEMDYQAVMNIGGSVDVKLDSIPELYYIYLQNNNHVLYVEEQNGYLVSMVSYALDSDGTQVTRVASVKHRSHTIGNSVKAKLHKDYPRVKRELYSAINPPEEIVIDQSSVVYRWSGNAYILSIHDALSQMVTDPSKTCNLIDLSYSTSIDWLAETNTFEEFFQQYVSEYMPVNSTMKPIRLLNKHELKEVFTSSRVFISVKDFPKGESMTTKQLKRIISLSYCSILLLHERCRVDLYYYGQVAGLQDHVRAQLSYITTVWEGNVSLFLHFTKNLQFYEVENCLNELRINTKLVPEYKHFEATVYLENLEL